MYPLLPGLGAQEFFQDRVGKENLKLNEKCDYFFTAEDKAFESKKYDSKLRSNFNLELKKCNLRTRENKKILRLAFWLTTNLHSGQWQRVIAIRAAIITKTRIYA